MAPHTTGSVWRHWPWLLRTPKEQRNPRSPSPNTALQSPSAFLTSWPRRQPPYPQRAALLGTAHKCQWKNVLFFHAKAGQGQYYKEGPAKTHKGRPRLCCSLTPKSDQQHRANRRLAASRSQCRRPSPTPASTSAPHYSPSSSPAKGKSKKHTPEATSRLGPVLQTEQKGEKGCTVFTSRQRKPGEVSLETSTAVMPNLI